MLQGAHTTPYGSLGCDVLPYIFHNSFAQFFQLGVHLPDCLHLVQLAAAHVVGTEVHCGERVFRELLIGQSCVDVGASLLDIFLDLGPVDGILIANDLTVSASLTSADFRFNEFGPEGAKALAPAIAASASLTKVRAPAPPPRCACMPAIVYACLRRVG